MKKSYAKSLKEYEGTVPLEASKILEAMKRYSDRINCHVAVAVGLTERHSRLPADFLVNESQLNELFGQQAEEVMEILSKPFRHPPEQRQLDHAFSLAPDRAKQWLQKKREN